MKLYLRLIAATFVFICLALPAAASLMEQPIQLDLNIGLAGPIRDKDLTISYPDMSGRIQDATTFSTVYLKPGIKTAVITPKLNGQSVCKVTLVFANNQLTIDNLSNKYSCVTDTSGQNRPMFFRLSNPAKQYVLIMSLS